MPPRRLALALALLVPLAGRAADAEAPLTAATVLAAADLQADLDLLERAWEQLHPGLYRYLTPAQLKAEVAAVRRRFRRDLPLGEAYLVLSQLAARVRCGHTWLSFYNADPAVEQALFAGGARRVPFFFRWLDGRMVITRNGSADPSLVPGTEVLAIDRVPARRLLERLMTVARADGSNDAKRVSQLQVQGEDRYEAFDVFLPLLFPAIGERQSLLVRSPGERTTRTVVVQGLTHAQRLAMLPPAPAGSEDTPGWTFSFPQEDLALLTMPSWVLYKTKWDWQGFLRDTFTTLAERTPRALVIDLRANEGGSDVGDVLLGPLLDQPLTVPNPQRRVRSRAVPADLAPHLDTWDRSFFDWGKLAGEEGPDGLRRLVRDADDEGAVVIPPRAPRFTGRVFVLIGATNSSATFEFAQRLQGAKLATLVGQPTGGNKRGINGGAFFFLRLPRTHLEVDLPLIGQFPATPQPDEGITPDVLVKVTLDDLAKGRDVELAAVRRLLDNEAR